MTKLQSDMEMYIFICSVADVPKITVYKLEQFDERIGRGFFWEQRNVNIEFKHVDTIMTCITCKQISTYLCGDCGQSGLCSRECSNKHFCD